MAHKGYFRVEQRHSPYTPKSYININHFDKEVVNAVYKAHKTQEIQILEGMELKPAKDEILLYIDKKFTYIFRWVPLSNKR